MSAEAASPLARRVREAYLARYGEAPHALVRAPGRVNLIGEHTDYNDGFVLPMAIDRAMWIALGARDDGRVELYSLEFETEGGFDLDRLEKAEGWLEYPKGVAWALQAEGYELTGWQGILSGDVPRGAGLSSSAALELAVARAFYEVSAFPWDTRRIASLAQRAENEWLGVSTGIMDQLISAAGEAGRALLLDCRSLESRAVPLPERSAVVVLDTATRRGLVDSAYNERRAQCEAAARHFGVAALRDVSPEDFSARAGELPKAIRRRARHVIGENVRVLKAAEAMASGDAAAVGMLMNESHASLRDDFEVSNEALDVMAAAARAQDACYGARMTGAGFGGCAVALVQADGVDLFTSEVSRAYRKAMKLEPQVYVCRASRGAESISL